MHQVPASQLPCQDLARTELPSAACTCLKVAGVAKEMTRQGLKRQGGHAHGMSLLHAWPSGCKAFSGPGACTAFFAGLTSGHCCFRQPSAICQMIQPSLLSPSVQFWNKELQLQTSLLPILFQHQSPLPRQTENPARILCNGSIHTMSASLMASSLAANMPD